ncbi:4Fe-4S dicluster domain-containing protein [Clostridioides difficile]|uniref:4Fe-4S dicluster domain-containing protein n=1 Tax=Clostridioides difficile TaxID=1496 RepID=UPI0010B5BD38|nr:iron-sulfur protein [Clostridioides difficile]VIG42691.1 iron-sulfur protein [Clostridioides difficile]VIH02510.1 iron-sulfur protein [Clostridioides difficile]VIH10802.1 iron-sulfur protein [Clostridioides difficile]VIH53274.1 iron-sulfur protein [Clostridioides difficile]
MWKCIAACPIDAISKVKEDGKEYIKIDEDRCLGCGVCVRNCHKNSIMLLKRDEKIITPANSVHRAVLMAIEKGQLQNLIFDNNALASHRAMGAILSAILKLEPAKKILASKQLKSVYLDKLLSMNDK